MATETAWSMRGDVMEACSCATTCPCNLDSWATDGHKWLNIPFDNGFVFVADPQAHSAALTQATSYSIPIEGIRNPMNWNLEWSRRARGYPIYAACGPWDAGATSLPLVVNAALFRDFLSSIASELARRGDASARLPARDQLIVRAGSIAEVPAAEAA